MNFILFKSIIEAYKKGIISRARFICEWDNAQRIASVFKK